MAGVPAYRYDHEVARPYSPSAPSVRVVPGRKHAVNPALSDFAVTGIKVVIACLVVFLIMVLFVLDLLLLLIALLLKQVIYVLKLPMLVLQVNHWRFRKACFQVRATFVLRLMKN